MLVGFNDLATTNPELAKEWNYEKNELTPKDVIADSPKKYWWKCKGGHEWYASLASRNADKVGCPHCTHQIVISGVNDFLTLYTEKAKLWDYEKNFPKKPSDFFPHSNKTVYWKCKNGHSYPSTISHITSGRGCPVCSNKKIQIGFNDLLTTNPEVAKEWNYDKNTIDIYSCSKGSSKKVWWKCKKGHVWKATISSRTNGCNCPECSKEKRTSLPEKTIYYYVNKSFKDSVENKRLVDTSQMELDIYVPSLKLGIEYDGEAWHGNVENDLKKDELCDKLGITLIRIRENGCPKYQGNSIKIYCENPHDKIWLLEETILSIFKEINNLFGLSVYEKIEIKNDFIEIYKLLDIQKKKNSLAELSPLHAKQWNYERNNGITPWMVANKTQKEYWWKCEKGHEWIARVSGKTRAKKALCPKCKKSTNKRKTSI